MVIQAIWSKYFTINDANSSELLYLAEFHPFGWFCPKPLGARGGFILHNGVARKDPVLAAACDVTVFEQRVNPANTDSYRVQHFMQSKIAHYQNYPPTSLSTHSWPRFRISEQLALQHPNWHI
jgi:hypothetical protein